MMMKMKQINSKIIEKIVSDFSKNVHCLNIQIVYACIFYHILYHNLFVSLKYK